MLKRKKMDVTIKHQFPTNAEFNALFKSVGWGSREDSKIDSHRKSSVFSTCAYLGDQIVGMARVVATGHITLCLMLWLTRHITARASAHS